MANRLKKRPMGEADEALHWFEGLVATNKNFETRSLCNQVIFALLSRIKLRSHKEARFLRRRIHLLAALERCVMPSAESVEELVTGKELTPTPTALNLSQLAEDLLRAIVHGKVPRSHHDRHTLSDQRNWLTKYFGDHPVAPSLSSRRYHTWLKEHAKPLHEGLSRFYCLCEYRTSFDDITENKLWDCHGPGNLLELLLAELHRSTPSAVHKALKPSAIK